MGPPLPSEDTNPPLLTWGRTECVPGSDRLCQIRSPVHIREPFHVKNVVAYLALASFGFSPGSARYLVRKWGIEVVDQVAFECSIGLANGHLWTSEVRIWVAYIKAMCRERAEDWREDWRDLGTGE